MEKTSYSISEAGKLVGVESHVRRYWEDEATDFRPASSAGRERFSA